ncbi:response regulator [Aminomonas paucivorans]|uniref:Two component transcriptional regulator, LuxR family n=1 Tax=Aminomonas paucivorans DSM 12260 TaxID=584708 RepID=E3CX35_9BACT|nr:response regulator transcription factor [Aminomonas paucivorans]EFQ24382.1 two component transcriptional regulator, LuxR family [Aminomonas paucivorans DSM 12260]
MSITLILADDHPLTREGLRAYLTREPEFRLLGDYADGDAAWKAMVEFKPRVALLDVRMPGQDGVSLARRIKQEGLPVTALMLTSYDAQPYVLASLKAGARGYVLKTSPAETLCRAIRVVAQGGLFLDSEVAEAMGGDAFVPEPISPREREVLVQAAQGLSSKEIAAKLYISERTVQTHLASIYDKVGAKNKTEAMLLALRYGLVTLEELLG